MKNTSSVFIFIVVSFSVGFVCCSGGGRFETKSAADQSLSHEERMARVAQITIPTAIEPPSLEQAAQLHKRGDGIFFQGKYIFHGASSGLKIFKKDKSGKLLFKAGLYLPGAVADIYVHENMAFVTCGAPGLFIVDVTDKTDPKLLWHLRFKGAAHRLSFEDGLLLVSLGTLGVAVVEAPAGQQPKVKGYFASGDLVRQSIFVDDSVFMAETRQGITVLHYSSEQGLVFGSRVDTDGEVRALAFKGDHLFVADGTRGLKIFEFNIEDRSLTLVGSYATDDIARDIWIENHRAMIAVGDKGVLMLDISNPAEPTAQGQWANTKPVNRVRAKGNVMYLGNDSAGLVIIDVTDPQNSKQIYPVAKNK